MAEIDNKILDLIISKLQSAKDNSEKPKETLDKELPTDSEELVEDDFEVFKPREDEDMSNDGFEDDEDEESFLENLGPRFSNFKGSLRKKKKV